MNTMSEFHGDRLRLARVLNGLTQQELGEQISVTRQYVHQLETDATSPATDVLSALCEVLQVEEGFFKIRPGNDVKPEQCHFRKRRTTPLKLSRRALAFSTVFENLTSFIHEKLDLPKKNIPLVVPADKSGKYANEEIERAAETCRKEWSLGIDTPISNMCRLLEGVGVLITHYEGVSNKIDALSLNRKYPIIVRNTAKESICRMRFDMGHELGHFVLHDGVETGTKQTESEADKFSSAFIFPRAAFAKEFGSYIGKRLNWNEIYRLKIRWKMSAKAIIYRAHFLGLIDARQYRSANVHLNKTGQAKKEDYDENIEPETPELLVTALEMLNEHLGIRFSDVAKKLEIKTNLLSQLTSITPHDEIIERVVLPFAV